MPLVLTIQLPGNTHRPTTVFMNSSTLIIFKVRLLNHEESLSRHQRLTAEINTLHFDSDVMGIFAADGSLMK